MKELKDYEYFRTELGVLYCGDCLEILPLIPDKSVDLVLTDPPYGIGEANNNNHSRSCIAISKDYGRSDWDNNPMSNEQQKELFRISTNQIIFGGNFFELPPSPCWIVWDKDNGENDFADCELAWTSFKTAVRRIKYRWQGMLQGDMKNKEERVHPTQKPLPVIKWILKRYSEKGQLICDPFSGSGTTALATEQLQRRWIAIEISEKYCADAKYRLTKWKGQERLPFF